MAILKKGSKGKIVEYLQIALNKLKAKPPLKVDGIFGPKTRKAVKEFQKRVNLKPDGQIGELTTASIKFGGKLPEMKVKDYVKKIAFFAAHRKYNVELVAGFMRIRKIVDILENKFNQEIFQAARLSDANGAHFNDVRTLGLKIASFQQDFKKMRLKDPKVAQKIALVCEMLEKKLLSDAKSKITPNHKKIDAIVSSLGQALGSSLSKLDNEIRTLKKNTKVIDMTISRYRKL